MSHQRSEFPYIFREKVHPSPKVNYLPFLLIYWYTPDIIPGRQQNCTIPIPEILAPCCRLSNAKGPRESFLTHLLPSSFVGLHFDGIFNQNCWLKYFTFAMYNMSAFVFPFHLKLKKFKKAYKFWGPSTFLSQRFQTYLWKIFTSFIIHHFDTFRK